MRTDVPAQRDLTWYAQALDAAWAAHLASRAADAPTLVSTFAGCGGSSLGYSMAGYRELLAVEWNDEAAAVFAANLPGVQMIVDDITGLDPSVLPLGVGELDLLDGSPPCQGVSSTGLRRLDDPRNQLWRQFARLAEAWQPKLVVVENVAGLARGDMRPIYLALTAELRRIGYRVAGKLVDASWLGVPQARHRTIIVGVRGDLGLDPVHPQPGDRQPTVRDAFAGLPDPGLTVTQHGKITGLVPLIPPGRRGADVLPGRGGRNHYFNIRRFAWDRPAHTIVAMVRIGTSGELHPRENRLLGIAELSRLQSFPDRFDWLLDPEGKPETEWLRAHRLIGNSVPPLMARAVGETLLPLLTTR